MYSHSNTKTKDKQDWRIEVSNFYVPSEKSLLDLDYQSSREGMAVMIHGMYVSSEWNWGVLKQMTEAYLSKVRDYY